MVENQNKMDKFLEKYNTPELAEESEYNKYHDIM